VFPAPAGREVRAHLERVRIEPGEAGVDEPRDTKPDRVGRVPWIERLRILADDELDRPILRRSAATRRENECELAKHELRGIGGAVRKLLLAAAMVFVTVDAPAQQPNELEGALRTLEKAVSGAKVGVYVVDMDGDKVLAASGEHTALNPASNAKLVTAAAALALLHPEHRYETTLSGKVKDGANGPLCLRGFGDPSLEPADLQAMARELHDRGVRRVDDILVDQKYFD